MGFGNFSSRGETDMILRNSNTGGVEVYDIANNDVIFGKDRLDRFAYSRHIRLVA